MNKRILLPILALLFSFHAFAGDMRPQCHDKDKKDHAKKENVPPGPPPPPTAEEAERVTAFLAQADISNRKLTKEFRKVMGANGKKMLRDFVKAERAQGRKVTKAQRQEFMKTTLANWARPAADAAAPGTGTGVTYDQYLAGNGNITPPAGTIPPVDNSTPPLGNVGNGTVGVIPPATTAK